MKNINELKAKYEALGREIEQLENGAVNPLFIPKEGDFYYKDDGYKIKSCIDRSQVGFRDEEYAKRYDKSTGILKRFHAHPLAVPIEDGVQQWIFWGDGDVNWVHDGGIKASSKSPTFATKEDCEKAVADIGREAILQAYKDTSWCV